MRKITNVIGYFIDDLQKFLFFDIDSKRRIKKRLKYLLRFTNENIDINFYLLQMFKIKEFIEMDIEMFLISDPAATSKDEIVLCYPGLFSILIYRCANILSNNNCNILARLLSEYAHSKTGIDIHPAAVIGHHFFIDHGTGIVIGQTTNIGNYVKIYQGVTLGAISLNKGNLLKNIKRHPTILDNVTIYANASILGGETIIGNNSIIGCNAFVTKSVDDNSVISIKDR